MSQGMIRCKLEERSTSKTRKTGNHKKQATGESTGLVTDTVWWPPKGVQVPTALVTSEEVLVPLMNHSSEPIEVGIGRIIAILDEASGTSSEVGQVVTEMPTNGPDPVAELPEHLEDLYIRAQLPCSAIATKKWSNNYYSTIPMSLWDLQANWAAPP